MPVKTRIPVVCRTKDKPAGVEISGRQTLSIRPPPSSTFSLDRLLPNPFIAGKCIPRAHLHFSHSTHFTLPPSLRQTSVCSATSICFIQYWCGGSTAGGETQGPPNRRHSLPRTFLHRKDVYQSAFSLTLPPPLTERAANQSSLFLCAFSGRCGSLQSENLIK